MVLTANRIRKRFRAFKELSEAGNRWLPAVTIFLSSWRFPLENESIFRAFAQMLTLAMMGLQWADYADNHNLRIGLN